MAHAHTIMLIFTVFLPASTLAYVANGESCTFPPTWRDSWVMNGFGRNFKVSITRSSFSNKGTCINSTTDNKYLLRHQSLDDGVCYRCLLFATRHVNVIQYKEAIQCQPPDVEGDFFGRLCDGITADSLLHTLVREHAVPISCPEVLQGPLKFTYDRGLGPCSTIADSRIGSCASTKKLRLVFEQCDEITEYMREDVKIQCLATWKSRGNWLYVKYGSNDYRCMNYDATSKALSISGDASCSSIAIIWDAPNILQWSDVPTMATVSRCDFPSWFTKSSWSDLQAEYYYRQDVLLDELVVDRKVQLLHSGFTETSRRHTCTLKVSESSNEVKFVTKSTNECAQGYQCLVFRKKSSSVMELVTGRMVTEPSQACLASNLQGDEVARRLLVDDNAPLTTCPLSGKYKVEQAGLTCPTHVEMACDNPSLISISSCQSSMNLVCLASWRDSGANYLIISEASYPRSGNCYRYQVEGNDVVIDLAEECNHEAPLIIPPAIIQTPYRLPPPLDKCQNSAVQVSEKYSREARTDVNDGDSSSGSRNECGLTLLLCLAVTLYYCFGKN